MLHIHKILKQYWGYDAFRPMQEDIINSIINGNDTLALLPTGGGKSICFQVPALASEGVCVVISPLVALMKDQVENLAKVGVKAAFLFSGMSKREIDITLDNCVFGHYKFLYVSPERLQTEIFIERFKRMKVCFLAVDEAHCISQWGYDFRPPYLEIAKLRELKPDLTFMALTASATPEVQKDIIEKLEFGANRKQFQKSFDRPNIVYAVTQTEDKHSRILYAIKRAQGTGILYVRNRKQTKELSNWLISNGISSDFYHAGLSNEERSRKQEAWKSGRIRMMVCTNAFGMGIDKANVRLVLHYGIPDSLEAYYQEAGRAGRDGKKAFAVCLVNQADKHNVKEAADNAIPSSDMIRRVYNCLGNHLQIPIGSGVDTVKKFALGEFALKYELKPKELLSSLKMLESHGLIQLSESFYNPSKVMMRIKSDEVYAFMVANAKLELILKAILRTSAGVFDAYVRIQEQHLASLLKTSTKAIKEQLQLLVNFGVIDYQPAREGASITFLHSREEAKHLQLNREFMEMRRKVYLAKAKGIIEYVDTDKCRSQKLLSYFGEVLKNNCGHCDYCLSNEISVDLEQIEKTLLEKAKEGISFEDLKLIMNLQNKKIQDLIRYLVDQGILRNKEGVLTKV